MDIRIEPGLRLELTGQLSTVNRRVAGSSPACGARSSAGGVSRFERHPQTENPIRLFIARTRGVCTRILRLLWLRRDAPGITDLRGRHVRRNAKANCVTNLDFAPRSGRRNASAGSKVLTKGACHGDHLRLLPRLLLPQEDLAAVPNTIDFRASNRGQGPVRN